MKIQVKAFPSAGEYAVTKTGEDQYTVYVKEPPVKGAANKAIIKLLAEHFKISASGVRLIHGFKSRHKAFEILK